MNWMNIVKWLGIALTALLMIPALRVWRVSAPSQLMAPASGALPVYSDPLLPNAGDLRAFSAPGSTASIVVLEEVRKRWRLAGTYLNFAGGSGEDVEAVRMAILDDLQSGRQRLLAQGGELQPGFSLAEVTPGSARFAGESGEFTLYRRLTANVTEASAEDPEKPAVSFWDKPALETSRFGKRIEKDRWVLERKALMRYYQDMLDNPERLVKMYRSFHPDRNDDGEVAGYQIKMAGEQDFFRSVGLAEGDVVRAVNAMEMSSQRRAEFMIGEFVRSNLDAIVFDVERDGKEEKLIYFIRD